MPKGRHILSAKQKKHIIQRLTTAPNTSNKTIAQETGLPESTVRSATYRFRRTGQITTYRQQPEPKLKTRFVTVRAPMPVNANAAPDAATRALRWLYHRAPSEGATVDAVAEGLRISLGSAQSVLSTLVEIGEVVLC